MGNKTNKKNQSGLSNYFQELNVNAPLFDELEKDPVWWRILREDKDLYINVRKDNYINVYYRGASVMKLSYSKGKFKSAIHNYYLGVDKDIAEEVGYEYGPKNLSPLEIVSKIKTIKHRVESNKKNKADIKDEDCGGADYSEKYVQGKMYLTGSYLDTEFALSLDSGTPIRMDLVKVDSCGNIQFEELKLVGDIRLTNGKIEKQMSNYNKFLEGIDKKSVVDYYNRVLVIMRKIKILPDRISCDKINGVNDDVRLVVTKYKKKGKTNDRWNRLNKIKCLCDANNIKSNIDEVLADYESI